MIDSIGFDLDGTLWDYAGEYAAIFGEIAQDTKGMHAPTAEEVYRVTGLAAVEYVETLFPELNMASEDVKREIFHRAEVLGCASDRMQCGPLYPGTEKMLAALSKRYALFIASNCEPLYLETFLDTHGLRPYFADRICQHAPGAKATKGENIRVVIERNGWKHTVFVGDAQSDADAAAYAGVPFVWANYGYGSVPNAAYRIAEPCDLLWTVAEMESPKRRQFSFWQGLNKTLQERLCEALRDRITYFYTSYHDVHNVYGRAAIRLDGKELARFSWIELYRQDEEVSAAWAEIGPLACIDSQLRERWTQSGTVSEKDFLLAAANYRNLSITEALESPDPLIRIFAYLDRRLGKRTLRDLRQSGAYDVEPALVRQFVELRLAAEGLAAPDSAQ